MCGRVCLYLSVDSLVMTVLVVVIDESKDSWIKRCVVFLRLDVNVLKFYRSPKSLDPDVNLRQAAAVHANLV